MPNIVLTKLKDQPTDKTVKAKILTFLAKLAEDDTTKGLHIEKMNNPVDPRARTARVDQGWRAVLYCLDSSERERTYVYAGTFEHDTAIHRAKNIKVSLNAVNGAVELIGETMPAEAPMPPTETVVAQQTSQPVAPGTPPYLESHFNYTLTDLVDVVGFDETSARRLLGATSEAEVLTVAERFENAWQQTAALGLAVGDALDKIREDLGLNEKVEPMPGETEDERIMRALQHPASKMQFTFVEDDEELRRIIEGGDFGAWRVFLHPEQARYATRNYNGPFRLTGGAGTGKTVVLLHRARNLAAANPAASVVLTTFTKALAENLKRDLERLDPDVRLSEGLGEPGVLVRGLDQLSNAVRGKASASYADAAAAVFGAPIEPARALVGASDGWREAIDDVSPDLPASLLMPSFFEGEYLHVILPARVTTEQEYFAVRRPGRGVALDRKKRAAVWTVVDRYRKNARISGSLSFPEIAAISAAWLEQDGAESGVLADHVLIDEAQDLTPLHWQFLRALAREGRDDLFIAEDTHQRIYGQHVVLSRYGIKITGRSRRLTLNYRTTEENLRYALAVLAGAEYVDSESEQEGVNGYRSSRRGPQPVPLAASDIAEMNRQIATVVREWLTDDVDPSTIAILARTKSDAVAARDALNAQGVHVNVITTQHAGGDKPVALTMHTAKGMEFSRVVLYDISKGVVPNEYALRNAAPEEREDALLRERSLLYVAASRARDALVVSWQGTASDLLTVDE